MAIAAFLVNLPISTPPAAAVTAAGNVLAPVAASWLLERVDFHHAIDRVRDVIALVFLGALASMTVSATIGTTRSCCRRPDPDERLLAGLVGVVDRAMRWGCSSSRRSCCVSPCGDSFVPPLGWRRRGEAVVLAGLLLTAAPAWRW